MRAAHAAGSSGVTRNSASTTTSAAPIDERAVPEGEAGGSCSARVPVVSDRTRGPHEHVPRLAPVPARVHAHGTADRPGDPDEELEPGPARGRGAPREHRQRARRHRPARPVSPMLELLELAHEQDADTGEPIVGDEQVRASADHEHRRPGAGR